MLDSREKCIFSLVSLSVMMWEAAELAELAELAGMVGIVNLFSNQFPLCISASK